MLIPYEMSSLTRNGKLYIDYRPVSEIMICAKGWKHGMDAQIWQHREWRDFPGDLGLALVRTADEKDETQSIYRYINMIPKDVRQAVVPIRYQQFSILKYSSKFSAMRDLLVSAPLLAWLLVSKVVNENWSFKQLNTLLTRKQKYILHEIAGVSAKADLHLLRKVKLLNGTFQEQEILLKALRDDDLKHSIRHLRMVPVEVLAILLKLPELQGSKLVSYIINEGVYINVNDTLNRMSIIETDWNDTLRMATELNIPDAEKALHRCGSEDELSNLHDRWTQRFNHEGEVIHEKNISLPTPPFPDCKYITAIRSSQGLKKEGREMHNCVGSYTQEVLAGRCYIYKVYYPDRATLELRLQGDVWQIGQFLIQANKTPSEMARQEIVRWLDSVSN